MKKFLTIVAGLVLTCSVVLGQQQTRTANKVVLTAQMTNVLGSYVGGALVSQVILTAPADNTATIRLIDSVTNILAYTNAAYATLGTYGTNIITTYTNFFGTVNSFTNVGIIDYSNYVAAASYNYPIMVTITAATNTSILLPSQALFFNNAVWATNMGSGNATITINYSPR